MSIRDVIKLLYKSDKKSYILDYGCGNASFIKSVANSNRSSICLALDIIQNAQAQNLPENVHYQIIEPFVSPKITNSFDIIFCMNMLYHLTKERIKELLEWFLASLSRDGVIYLTTKSTNNFPKFKHILNSLSIDYSPIADEKTFNSENCRTIILEVFSSPQFSITYYPIETQVITQDFLSVVRYMASNNRFKNIIQANEAILNKLQEQKIYIDSYHETIIRIATGRAS